jgi:hypothetical protein
MAHTLTQEHDPFVDGLGKASNVGVGFLRRFVIDCNASDATPTIVPSDVGVMKFLRVVSIVPKTSGHVYVSSFAENSITFTAAANTDIFEAFVLCSGM